MRDKRSRGIRAAYNAYTESLFSPIFILKSKMSFYFLKAQVRRMPSLLSEMCQLECGKYTIQLRLF